MKRTLAAFAACLALWLFGGCKSQAPEPINAPQPKVSTGGTPVPTMQEQRQDKRGD